MTRTSTTTRKAEAARPRMNAAWHKAHPMARDATLEQRLAWHRAHQTACGCRPVPATLRPWLKG